MSRALALGLAAVTAVWLGLYWYDTGDSHTADWIVIAVTLVPIVIVVAHMAIDRRLTLWNAGSVGILVREIGWCALFLWFALRLNGERDPGLNQGLLDVVRAAAPVGGVMISYWLITYRLDMRRAGTPTVPGEMLTVHGPTYIGPERRSGRDRRRSPADIYDRGTE
jgi:hypothetical protein